GEEADECFLTFVAGVGPYEGNTSPWLFGIPILRRYCPVFDFGNSRVGFSETIKDFG
ncbi:hypothetical protein AAVH_12881, partial [Aphelenchoides avenae]